MRGATFTDRVKAELARHRTPRPCCRRAELAAILRSAGTFHILGGGPFALEVDVADAGMARKVYAELAGGFAEPAEVRILEPGRARPRQRFLIRVQDADAGPFITSGVLDASGRLAPGVPSGIVARRCCAGAYLRGAFLSHGSVSDPRAPVQIEIRARDAQSAAGIRALAYRVGVSCRTRDHRGAVAVYAKDGPGVGRLLAAMGAHNGYLEWEDGAVWKAVRGEANRLANCDEANARRTAGAAMAQRGWAERALARFGEEGLPHALREVAQLRLANPDASLEELGRLCRPPVSKPAVAGRMRRLERMADDRVG